MNNHLKIFCDFDGTISRNDVRTLIFKTFGDERAHDAVVLWLENKITGVECIERECRSVERINVNALNELIDRQEIDPQFPNFVSLCKSSSIEVFILSDGFDYYIKRILRKYDLLHVPFFANHLEIREHKLIPSFPFFNPYCERSANCKGTHVLNNAQDDEIRVIIGDGYSDRCAADYADIVFAKRRLVQYCREKNISYYDFTNFGDVKKRIEEILSRKRLKPRYRAELRRREAFRIEANV